MKLRSTTLKRCTQPRCTKHVRPPNRFFCDRCLKVVDEGPPILSTGLNGYRLPRRAAL